MVDYQVFVTHQLSGLDDKFYDEKIKVMVIDAKHGWHFNYHYIILDCLSSIDIQCVRIFTVAFIKSLRYLELFGKYKKFINILMFSNSRKIQNSKNFRKIQQYYIFM